MDEILKRLKICIEGHCYICPYFHAKCTDDLINDIYNYDVIVLWMDINNSMNKGNLKGE
jgi:hypothetical protein